MLKITVTYPDCAQVGPDTYRSYTKVVHLTRYMTLLQAISMISKDWPQQNKGSVELQWDSVDDKEK